MQYKIILGLFVILVIVIVYTMYRRSVYLEHMEISRLINEKLSTGRYFKLDAEKMQSRGPSFWERFTTSLSNPVYWKEYMDDITKNH